MKAGVRKVIFTVRTMVEDQGLTMLGEVSVDKTVDPFKVLIATILSQRTRDETTSGAVDDLFSRYSGASDLAEADKETLKEIIKPVNFYRVKATRIIEVAKIILKKFGGRVPSDLEDLMSLPSVGRKTANCVLVYGFQKLGIPVDTHVHRISNRIGLVDTKSPDETESRLREIVSQDFWMGINENFIKFGKTICRPIGPRCNICKLTNSCKAYNMGIF